MSLPFHTHKGRNYWRILALSIFIIIALFSVYSIIEYTAAFITLTIGSLIGILSIRFPKIFLYNDKFRLLKKSMIGYFTEDITFEHKNIKNIEFSEGFTDKSHIIVLALTGFFGTGGYAAGGNSKADQMIIKMHDGKLKIINRFGKKSEFIKTIELIKKKIDLR